MFPNRHSAYEDARSGQFDPIKYMHLSYEDHEKCWQIHQQAVWSQQRIDNIQESAQRELEWQAYALQSKKEYFELIKQNPREYEMFLKWCKEKRVWMAFDDFLWDRHKKPTFWNRFKDFLIITNKARKTAFYIFLVYLFLRLFIWVASV